MFKFAVISLSILFLSTAFSQEEDEIFDPDDVGPFLIYNCEKGHWSCVSEARNEDCQKQREEDKKRKDVFRYRCASIEKQASDKACFQRQLFNVSNNLGTRFCIKDEWKEKSDLSNH